MPPTDSTEPVLPAHWLISSRAAVRRKPMIETVATMMKMQHRHRRSKAVLGAAFGKRQPVNVADEDVRPTGLRVIWWEGRPARRQLDHVEVVEVVGEGSDQKRRDRDEQQREHDRPECLERPRPVDGGSLGHVVRDRLQGTEADEEHVGVAEPELGQEDREPRRPFAAEPVDVDSRQAVDHPEVGVEHVSPDEQHRE